MSVLEKADVCFMVDEDDPSMLLRSNSLNNNNLVKELDINTFLKNTGIENFILLINKLELLKKTSEMIKAFKSNKLDSELDRSKERKIRAGAGTRRGRKYKTKIGPLIVVSKACPAMFAADNLQGVEVSVVNNLNAELLAPGGDIGRTTVWSKSALEKLGKEKLFI